MTINEDILNASILHMVWMERFKTSEVKKIISLLNKADDDLVSQIAARMTRIEARGYDLGPATTKRLDELLKFIKDERAEAMKALYEANRDDLFDFAQYEADFQSRVITSSAASAGVTVEMAAPALSRLKAAETSQPFQGRLLREWYRDLAADTAKKVSDAVKIGIVEGQTTDQIVRRIKGTRARQYRDGVLNIPRNNVASIVRTAISHTAARAKDELYDANSDILEGVKFNATLDSSTTPICRSLDGRIYKIGAKRPVLPLHFGERSQYVPYLGPTSIPGTRASATGPVPDDMDYGDWLRKQPVAVQNEALGVKKAQLFRKGGMDISKFSDSTGKEYTLDELRKRDNEIWNKVFG